MKKFVVEMAVGFCASLTVDAKNKEEASQQPITEVTGL